MNANELPNEDNRRVITASLVALGLGTLISIAVVLPAEYGVDPTGLGRALGLLQLASGDESVESPAPAPAVEATGGRARDAQMLELAPGEGVEYKLRMVQGGRTAYRWVASGIVHFDLHGEPAGDTSGYYESYAVGEADAVEGRFTAVFDGTHGWYWRNDQTGPVQIELQVSGEYTEPAIR